MLPLTDYLVVAEGAEVAGRGGKGDWEMEAVIGHPKLDWEDFVINHLRSFKRLETLPLCDQEEDPMVY